MEHSLSVTSHTEGGLPAHVAQVAEAMSHYPGHWALCGGWAVDAWLGRVTREHGDVDISILADEQHMLFDHLRGWQLVGHDVLAPVNNQPWDGRPLVPPGHLHGRVDRGEPAPESGIMTLEDGFILDVQINEREGDGWVLSRDPLISLPLTSAVMSCPWGLPAVVPEVLLFYKAQDLRRRDKLDFVALLPTLGAEQRGWLRDALARCGHPWLSRLAAEDRPAPAQSR
jgi:hypothetical protein